MGGALAGPLKDLKKHAQKKVAHFFAKEKEIADEEKRNKEFPVPNPDAVEKVKEIIRKCNGKKKVNCDKILGEPCNYVFKSGKRKVRHVELEDAI